MNILSKSAVATAAFLLVTAASAAPITYNMNLSVGDGTAVGQITTDGTIGSVGTGNVLSFSILLSPVPGSQFTITESNAGIGATANLLATANDLSFDFGATGYWLMQNPSPGSGVNFLCFSGGGQLCGGFSGGIAMSTDQFGADFTAERGVSIVATAGNTVPEPASFGLAALALLGVVASSRRRQA